MTLNNSLYNPYTSIVNHPIEDPERKLLRRFSLAWLTLKEFEKWKDETELINNMSSMYSKPISNRKKEKKILVQKENSKYLENHYHGWHQCLNWLTTKQKEKANYKKISSSIHKINYFLIRWVSFFNVLLLKPTEKTWWWLLFL